MLRWRRQRPSDHQTVMSSLAAGFAGVTLFVAVVVFVLGTVLARPPARRRAACRAARIPGTPGGSPSSPRGRVAVTVHGYRYTVQDERTTAHRPTRPPFAWPGRHLDRARARNLVTVLAVMHGIRLPGPEVVLSVALMWLLLIGRWRSRWPSWLRRHHRAAARHALRHGKRGALFAGRHGKRAAVAAGRRGRAGSGHLAAKAAARWENREHRPLMFTRKTVAQPAGGAGFTPVVLTARSKSGRVLNPVTGEPVATVLVKDPDDLKRRLAAVTRYPDIEVSTRPWDGPGGNGRIHLKGKPPWQTPSSSTTAPATGWEGPAQGRPRGARRAASHSAGWAQVISDTTDFEPEDDGHLLNWMAAEVNGMSAYAEALTEVYETCVNTVGLDPVAMNATHDVADAAAEAASAMANARAKFASHYSEVREFAASGGLLPFDGRWITGDGDA